MRSDVAQSLFFKRDSGRRPVDAFVAEFVEALACGIAPVKKRFTLHTVEFYDIARQMAVHDYLADASGGEGGEQAPGGVGGRGKPDVFGVCRVGVASFQPARLHSRLAQTLFDGAGGIDDEAVGIRNAVLQQDTGETVAAAVPDTGCRVYDRGVVVFQFFETVERFTPSGHVEDVRPVVTARQERLLGKKLDLPPFLSQVFDCEDKNGGIVAFTIG